MGKKAKKKNPAIATPKTKVHVKKPPYAAYLFVMVICLWLALTMARATFECSVQDDFGAVLDVFTVYLARPWEIVFVFRTSWEYGGYILLAGLFIIAFIYIDYEKNKNSYFGKEKGTAKWNTYKKYFERYAYPPGELEPSEPEKGSNEIGNLVLSAQVRLDMNIKRTFKNNNVFILGATGTGKTRYYVKPNLLQQNTSYIITDPSGELLQDIGLSLQKAGYVVKVFNLMDMSHSCSYNPFHYIKSDGQIPILVDCFVKNTTADNAGKGDEFFTKAEVQLLTALFYYVHHREPKEKQNFGRIVELLTMMKVDENNPNAKSKLDILFDQYEQEDPQATAVTNYKMFRVGAGKTLKSIIISANVRMRPFTLDNVRNISLTDTMALDELGDSKQAVFIITPTQIKTYNFLAAMMYTQLFQVLFDKGSDVNPNRYLVKYDCSSPIQSRVFTTEAERKQVESEFKAEWEVYKKALIKEVEREGISEDDAASIGRYKYQVVLEDGSVKKTFECKEQADYFMECVQKGKMERGRYALPSHVHFVLDEFANIGQIPEFDQIIATMRKFSLSCTLIVQSISQLKNMYKDNYDTLMSNCSSLVFLGTTSYDDAERISKMLGKTTQKVRNASYSLGKGSTNQSFNSDSLDLMTPDEILRKPSEDCIVIIEGIDPFYDKKYPLEKHPNYYQLGDADDKNKYSYKAYFKTSAAVPYGTPNKATQAINKNVGAVLNGGADKASIDKEKQKIAQTASQGNVRAQNNVEKVDLLEALLNEAQSTLPLSEEVQKGNNIRMDKLCKSINKNYKNNVPVDTDSGIKNNEIFNVDESGVPF